jgi:hypothetical protein
MNIKRDSIDMEAELFKLNPTVQVTDPKSPVTHGLLKREYFAAMALQGYIASGLAGEKTVAMHSVTVSDALIAELNK